MKPGEFGVRHRSRRYRTVLVNLSRLSAIINLTADEFAGYGDAHGVAGGTLDGLNQIRRSLLHVKPNAVPVRAFDPFLKDFRVPGHVHSFILDNVDVFQSRGITKRAWPLKRAQYTGQLDARQEDSGPKNQQ